MINKINNMNKSLRSLFPYTLIIAFFCFSCPLHAQAQETVQDKTVLLYGDSLVWGWAPTENPAEPRRFPRPQRIGGAMEAALGSGWTVIEEGLPGRTAGVDAAFWNFPNIDQQDQNFNGRRSLLPIYWSHDPVDMVIIILGSNDARNFLHQSIDDVKNSITALIKNLKNGSTQKTNPAILLVSPPGVQKGEAEAFNRIFDDASYALIRQYSAAFQQIAAQEGVLFFDAASVIPVADGIDGLHLSAQSYTALGKALAAFVKTNL
jgi:lysophospholipase L1-like esterase